MITDIEAAYLAGLFDGEGCITTGDYGHPSVSLVNTNKQILEEIQKEFGGSIYLTGKPREGRKACYQWFCRLEGKERFLKCVFPYAKIKRRQILIALELLEVKGKAFQKLSPELQFKRDLLITWLKEAK